MNYAQFKINRLRQYATTVSTGIKIKFRLTNLTYDGLTTVGEGEAYQCTLKATNGKYLPTVISVTGTVSSYAFKYDYTTGVIYIPSGEIYGDIVIEAVASETPTNVPAVFEVKKITADTTDGTNDYTGEVFFTLQITPARGSTVRVTFNGVTKEVVGDLTTSRYDSNSKEVFFGTYFGVSDGTTATSGTVTISGAYEAWGVGTYSTEKSTSTYCGCITDVTQWGVTRYIKQSSFRNCDSLTSITIPDSVTSIGNYAFYDCTSLTSVYYTGDIAGWCNIEFSGTSSNPLNNRADLYIGGNKVTNLIIPDTVTSIKSYAFRYCDSLTSVTIGNSVTSIGYEAFYNCDSLTSVTIGNSVTSIGSSAFRYCDSLTSVTIGNSVTSIGGFAFYDCTSLTSVTIPDSVTSIDSYAFFGCNSLASVTIPNSVTSIGDGLFQECNSLASVTIPNSVTSIGDYAFRYCTSLTSVTIPDSVTSIDSYAFSDCNSLASVTFENPNSWTATTSAGEATQLSASDLANTSTAATYLVTTYVNYIWTRA